MSETGSVSERKVALFHWRIDRDFTKRTILRAEILLSPDFRFFGHAWCIRVLTNSPFRPGTIDVWLWRRDNDPLLPPIRVTLGVRRSDGCVEERWTGTERLSTGWKIFLSHAELKSRRSELLSSGTLTVTCQMEVLDTEVQCKEDNFAGLPLERLSSDFEQLLVSKEKCDVTLRVADREFPAHRAVLVARSSVFKAMFHKDTAEEQTGDVEIRDCDPESFGAFLRFLYCGKLDCVTSENALHLYVTADKYDVRELKEFCLKYAERNVTVQNVCQVVCLADQYDEEDLMSAAQSFFNEKASEILQTAQWRTFMANHQRLANKMFLEFSIANVDPSSIEHKNKKRKI